MRESNEFPGWRTGVVRFFQWWKRELRALVPSFLRDLARPRTVALSFTIDSVAIVEDRRRGAKRIASSALDDERAVAALFRRARRIAKARTAMLGLRLQRDQCLVRSLALPDTTVQRLRAMVNLEVQRMLPRQTSEVLFDWTADTGRATGGRVPVDLVVAKRAHVDELLGRLSEVRIRPDFIDCWRDEKHRLPVDLSAALTPGTSKAWGLKSLNLALATACAALLLTAPLLWTAHRNAVNKAIEARVDEARAKLQEARTTAAVSDARQTAVARLIDRRASRPLLIEIWSELTRLMPDDAYAEEVTLDDRRLTIVGRARAAAALIPALELSPLFKEAGLSSSVVLDAESSLEQFTIKLMLEQGPETATIATEASIQ